MNPELVNHVDRLALSCTEARLGDIATLAELLDQCETLRQVSDLHQVAGLGPVADALGEHIKRMIMGEAPDDVAAMEVLRNAMTALQDAVKRGEVPPAEAFAAELSVQLAGGKKDGEAAAPAAQGNGAAGNAAAGAEPPPAEVGISFGGDEGAFAADEELLGEYLAEQRGRLEEIEGHLLTLERTEDETALADLRRALHTIKGDSGFLGLSTVAQISHAAESYLEGATYPLDLEHLFAVKDWLARAFEDLAAHGRLAPATQASLHQLLGQLGEPVAQAAAAAPGEPAMAQPADPQGEPAVGDSSAADLLAELTQPAPPDPAESHADPHLPPPGELGATTKGLGDVMPDEPPAPAREPVRAPAEPPKLTGLESLDADFQLTADESLLADFVSESKEHLDLASAQLLALESDPDNEEAINSVFRAFHTVKGIAGFLNLQEVSVLAHDTENLLDRVRRHEQELTPALIDLVFEALDWMTRLIGNVRKGLEGNGRAITEPELGPFIGRIKAAQQGRIERPAPGVRTQRLGEILVESGAVKRADMESALVDAQSRDPERKVGEVLVEKELVTPVQVHDALKQQSVQGQPERKGVEIKETLRVDYERLENMINTIGELVLAEAMISQDEKVLSVHSELLDKKLYNLRQVSRKLQELGTTIRMVPISGTFQKMARLVRDLSRKSGKPINFHSQGDETELDRAYVDLIADPLVHMIRNAVDHGVEPPAERRQRGKPDAGVIELRAFHEGGNIHVMVRDDGQGLDPERIFAKAVEKGLIEAEEREKITEQDIFQIIFLPGFSTAAQVTEVSGRGVGMDVVRRNISELRGQVQITSERQVGTTFRIILPLTLALIDGMLVRVGEERFIFPVLSVVESARPTRDMITSVVGKGEMISLRGRQLPLYRLNRLFAVPRAKEDVTEALVVVVENEGRQSGIVVDELIGIQQTVIKSLGSGMFDTKGLSGGSIMADGTVGLIVDIAGLIRMARTGESPLSNVVN